MHFTLFSSTLKNIDPKTTFVSTRFVDKSQGSSNSIDCFQLRVTISDINRRRRCSLSTDYRTLREDPVISRHLSMARWRAVDQVSNDSGYV